MELNRRWVDYESPNGQVSGYMAFPKVSDTDAVDTLPGVVVIQEVWGADDHICDVADRLATAGYVTLAPDLYSTGGGRPAELAFERVATAKEFLNSIPPGRWMEIIGDEEKRNEELSKLPGDRGREVGETLGSLFGGLRKGPEGHVAALRSSVSYLRTHLACKGRKVGSIGFCMGGSLSALLACEEPDLSAAVIFYGSSPDPEKASAINCPVRGFYGQDDPGIVAGLPAFKTALEKARVDNDLKVYPDVPHAFFNDTRPTYRIEAARDAWARTLLFFVETLN